MKKATLIAGITGLTLIIIGTYLVISGIQPHGGLLSIGFLIFWLAFLPMLLIYRLKNDKTGFQKGATIFGFIVGWLIIFPGMLFSIMRWPGGAFLNLIGMPLGIIFLVLFIISNKSNMPAFKGIFTIIIAAAFIVTAGGRQVVLMQKTDEIGKSFIDYAMSMVEKKQLDSLNISELKDIMKHEKDSGMTSAAFNFQDKAEIIEENLEKVKDELVAHSQGIDLVSARNFPVSQLYHPGDIDTPTHYMIGADPAFVTGKAKDIKMELVHFRDNILPQEIHLDINFDDAKNENGQMVSWEEKNFYHATIVDALTRITMLQVAVLEAEKEAFDKKIFSRK